MSSPEVTDVTDVTEDAGAAPDPQPRPSRFLPQTRAQAVLGVLVLMFLAGTIGMLIGVRRGDDAPSARSVDVGFLYDMSSHHEQALILAEIELTNGENLTIQRFAREIMRSQSYEIGLMAMRLGTWGHDPGTRPAQAMAWMGMPTAVDAMPGMADASELAAFRTAHGAEADALFVALMSDHHAGGVAMAEDAAARAGNEWIRDTASRMAAIQRQEIEEMGRARAVAGLSAAPAGYTADAVSGGAGTNGGHTGHAG